MATSRSPFRRLLLFALLIAAAYLAYRYMNPAPAAEPALELESPAAGVSGSWSYTLMAPEGAIEGTITLTGSPDNLRGMMSNVTGSGSESLRNIVYSDPYLSFEVATPDMDMDPITMEAQVRGDSFSGSLLIPGMEAIPINARRVER